MKKGDIVYGKITNIVGYGAFALVDDYDGLIHISEFSDNYVKNIEDFVKVGDEIRLKVLEVDEANKRVKLSYKQLHKTRGVRCRIPVYKVGFAPIKEKLDEWMKEYYERK
jgi:general stress protein 13